jgi:hypothetical protein
MKTFEFLPRLALWRPRSNGTPGNPPGTPGVILAGAEPVRATREERHLRPREWLLLLFNDAPQPIDRVRVQKAMFLFAMRSNAGVDEKYEFVPYKFGPFSFSIYPDLDRLVIEGLLREEEIVGLSSPAYVITADGRGSAAGLIPDAPPSRLALLWSMRSYVLERDFAALLNDVYRLYPSYAVRSVFR